MSPEVCSKILEIRPDFIHHINNRYIDTALYLEHIKNYPKHHRNISLKHFKNKDFLFYMWKLYPDLLTLSKYQHLLTTEIFTEFTNLYPEYLTRYKCPPSIEPKRKTVVKITEEYLKEHLDRGEIPKGKIPKELFTPINIERLFDLSHSYMAESKYRRQFVTRQLFDKYYFAELPLFPHYIDSKSLTQYYQYDRKILFEYIHLYDEDLLYAAIYQDIEYIQDPYIVYRLISRNEKLTHYISPKMLSLALATRKKSARS